MKLIYLNLMMNEPYVHVHTKVHMTLHELVKLTLIYRVHVP